MYTLVDGRHRLISKWDTAFTHLSENWPEESTPWPEVAPALRADMGEVSDGPSDDVLDRLFVWLERDVAEGDRRGLLDESPREDLFRRLLSHNDEDLADFFTMLYEPLDGDLYWNREGSVRMVFQQGGWRNYGADSDDRAAVVAQGWTNNPDQAAELGLPYWDGTRYQVYRDGQWQNYYADTDSDSADTDAVLAQGWTDDADQAAELGLPYWDGTRYQVYRDGRWQEDAGADDPAVDAAPVADGQFGELSQQMHAAVAELLRQRPELAQLSADQLSESIQLGLELALRG